DNLFLKRNKGSTEKTKFSWTIRLKGQAQKDKCSFKVSPFAVTLNISKKVPPSAEQTSGQQSADDANKGSPRTGAELTGYLDDAGNQLGMGEGTGTNADEERKNRASSPNPSDHTSEQESADDANKGSLRTGPEPAGDPHDAVVVQPMTEPTADQHNATNQPGMGQNSGTNAEANPSSGHEATQQHSSGDEGDENANPKLDAGSGESTTVDNIEEDDLEKKLVDCQSNASFQTPKKDGQEKDLFPVQTEDKSDNDELGNRSIGNTADVEDVLGSQDSISSLDSFVIIDQQVVQSIDKPMCLLSLGEAKNAYFEGDLLCVDGRLFVLFTEGNILKSNEVPQLPSGEQNGMAHCKDSSFAQEKDKSVKENVEKQGNTRDMLEQDHAGRPTTRQHSLDNSSAFGSQLSVVKQKRKEIVLRNVPTMVVKIISQSSFKSEFRTKFPDAEYKVKNEKGNTADIVINGSLDCQEWFQKEIHYCRVTMSNVQYGEFIPKLPVILNEYMSKRYGELGTVFWDTLSEKNQIIVWCSSSPSADEVVSKLKKAIKKVEHSCETGNSALPPLIIKKMKEMHNVLHVKIDWSLDEVYTFIVFCYQEDAADIKKDLEDLCSFKKSTKEDSFHSTADTFKDLGEAFKYSIANANGQTIAVSNVEAVNLDADAIVVLKENESMEDGRHEEMRAKYKVAESMTYALVEIEKGNCFKVAVACSESKSWTNGYKYLKFVLSAIFEFFKQNAEETSSTNDELAHAPEGVDQNSDTITSTAANQLAAENEASRSANETTGGSRTESSKLKVHVLKEEIISVKADVIVNSTNEDLDLEQGYVSAKINKYAGKKLQKTVNKEAKKINFNFWDYIVTEAFDLSNCKHIFHCALEPLKDIDQKDICLLNMRAMVRMLLNEANKMSCHSIALPALGTGNLGYHPKDAANAIFLAVCDFVELNGDTSHLQEIKIVIYEKDENTFQAFKKVQAEMAQEMGGRAKQPVPAFYFKERRLEAIVGSPDIINCDTVVCLLDNSNLKQGKSKDHPIICKLPSKTVQDWNKKRHSKGKFFSLNGAPWNCRKILTMEMKEKEKLQSVIKQSLLHADVDMKSFSVVFYFEETDVCLQRGKNLMKDFMDAFYDYGPNIERLMKVTVLLDGTQNATRVFKEFSNKASVSKPSTVNRSSPKEQKKSFQDDQKKKSKEEKGMTQETRPPPRPPLSAINSASSNSGSNRYRGNILKGWDPQRFLETDEVAMLVLVKGILPTETEEEVMFNLKKFVPEKKFELHFCPGMLSATLSFDTPQEKHPAEVLMKYEFSLPTKEVKEIESTEQIETFKSHFKKPIITFKANKDKTISFECKTKFALELVEMAKTYYTTKHIKMEAVSENILDVFSTKKKESIEHLKTDGGIVECDSATGKVTVSIPNLVLEKYKELEEYLKRITDSKNFGGSREFFIETYQTQKAQEVCQDLERTVTCECAYVPEKQLIVVLVEKYEHIKHVGNKIRELLDGKPSEVKPTGRPGRKRHTDDSSNNAESNKASASGGVHFESGKLKKIFQTKEKIDVHVYEGDILKLDVDCIVNAANEQLQHGGGVARAIARKAGYQLTKESEECITKHGSIPVGCAVSTSAGNLPYECVIHTVGPRWSDYSNQSDGKKMCCQKLYEAIMSSLQIAADKGMKSIALPAISSAIFGVPLHLCVVEYRQAVFDFSRMTGAKLKDIHFVDIKADVVKSIQDEFCNLQQTVDENRYPQYELNKPMSLKSSLKLKPRHSSDNENSGMHLKFKEENHTTVALINEPFHKLEILHGDLSAVDTDAVVLTIDEKGRPRKLTKHIQGKVNANTSYFEEVRYKQLLNNTTGNVIATGGCGSKYKAILHVILPCNLKYKESKEKVADLQTAYTHIFAEMSKDAQLRKVTTVLLGKGDNDVTFCASILWKSFHAFCRKELKGKAVHVVVVCYDIDEFEATRTAILEDALRETSSHSHDETDLNKDFAQSALENEDEDCVICMDTVKDPYPLKCGHMFCKECILKQFEFKKVCPMCGHVCGIIEGNQPTGKMIVSKESGNCHGYWNCGSILMRYEFPDGKQQEGHPNPGSSYRGIRRTGYLPDNAAGKTICRMMKVAFKRKLVFTIGNSRTTGRDGVITWNDIHHKTDPKPYTQFGYPDDTYLDRVKEELEIKGVTEKDIDSVSRLEGVVYTN
ncbi:DTX3L-like protein, partial [Mya arenaria]